MKIVKESLNEEASFVRHKDPIEAIGIGQKIGWEKQIKEVDLQNLLGLGENLENKNFQFEFNFPEAIYEWFIPFSTFARKRIYYFLENGKHEYVSKFENNKRSFNSNMGATGARITYYKYSVGASEVERYYTDYWKNRPVPNKLNPLKFGEDDSIKAAEIILNHYLKSRSKMK